MSINRYPEYGSRRWCGRIRPESQIRSPTSSHHCSSPGKWKWNRLNSQAQSTTESRTSSASPVALTQSVADSKLAQLIFLKPEFRKPAIHANRKCRERPHVGYGHFLNFREVERYHATEGLSRLRLARRAKHLFTPASSSGVTARKWLNQPTAKVRLAKRQCAPCVIVEAESVSKGDKDMNANTYGRNLASTCNQRRRSTPS
jgi:hypothetical protein